MKDFSLENVLINLVMCGADRGALVRPAQVGKAAAVCVIMLGAESMSQLGMKLVEFIRDIPIPADQNPGQDWLETIDTAIGLKQFFEIVDTIPAGWCYGKFRYHDIVEGRLILINRELETIARICTENRAPCSLDPEKPPKGQGNPKED